VGNAHELLRKAIVAMNTRHSRYAFYGNTVSLIQGSSTGKSHTVDKLSKLMITLPFNLRAKAEDHGEIRSSVYEYSYNSLREFLIGGAYPPADESVR
jgi:hypothetical protein